MASGAVRELITKVKFQLDKNSEATVKKSLQNVKAQLNKLAQGTTKLKVNADTSKANTSLQSLKTQLGALQGKTVTTYVQTKQKGQGVAGVASKASRNAANSSQFGSDFAGAVGVGAMSAGTAAGVAVAAAGAAAAVATKKFADFDATMSKVRALTKASDTDMRALTETARKLGATTKYSATEAAEAMTYLGMAGWKSKDIMKAMPGLLDLAAASGEDLARVSDIVSDDLTAFKMPAEQAGHFADVLAVASSNANTNVSLMGETFKYVGPLAGSLGYSIEDMALATGIMANGSIKGEQAGTTLRALLTRLVKPTKESAMAMERLGLNILDTNGKMKPFRQILADMRKGFSNLSEAEKGEVAAMLAGQEAMSGTLLLANENQSTIDNLTKALDNSNGASKEMAGVMNNNLNGALKEMGSAIDELALSLGQVLEPTVRDAVKGITGAFQGLAKDIEPYGKILQGPVGDTTEALEESRAEIAQLESEHPTFMALVELFKQVKQNAEEMSSAMQGFGESLAQAFGNETVNQGIQLLLQAMTKFAEFQGKVLGDFGTLGFTPVAQFMELGKLIVSKAVELMGELLTIAIEKCSEIGKAVAEFADGMIRSFGTAINSIKVFFSELADSAIADINRILDGMVNLELQSDRLRIRIGENAKAASASYNTQNNTFNLTNEGQLRPAMASASDGFSNWQ